ncbi:hypothetical protein, partial [Streptomyces sp. NPDC058272]|uniref:hypothetical protein n=1 Tax=Streptomyces sp. NPDC058272 TaxID=3346415 RepID=UPI0036E9F905
MATRPRGIPAGPGLVHHADASSQYASFAFTAHLLDADIDASTHRSAPLVTPWTNALQIAFDNEPAALGCRLVGVDGPDHRPRFCAPRVDVAGDRAWEADVV